MSTKAGTIGVSGLPRRFTLWITAVSVLAAAALFMSALALNLAGSGDRSVTSVARDRAPAERVGAEANAGALPSCVGCDQGTLFPGFAGALHPSRSLPSCVGCDQGTLFPGFAGALHPSRSLPSCVGCDQGTLFPGVPGALPRSRSLPSCVGCDQETIFRVFQAPQTPFSHH